MGNRNLTTCSPGLCLLLALICVLPAWAQKNSRDSLTTLQKLENTDLIDFGVHLLKLNKPRPAPTKDHVIFSIIPIAPASTGGGHVAVSAINAAFYLDSTSNLSTIYFYPYFNFKGSFGMIASPYIWLDNNNWNAAGDFRIIQNVLEDYGLGTSSEKENRTDINFSQIRSYFSVSRRVISYLYAGIGYSLDSYYNVVQKDTAQGDGHFINYPYGTGPHSVASGLTFNLLRDNRPNSINPEKGFFTTAILRINTKSMGSTTNWSSIYLETRKYFSFSTVRHKVLAWRTLYWSTYGDVLYFNLPATFQDYKGRAGRGYSNSRFRGQQMAYAEAEYRFDLSEHGFLGGVVFANAQAMSESNNKFQTVRPAAGAGLRLKFNRYSATNIALDFAVGKDGLNFYINLGEFF